MSQCFQSQYKSHSIWLLIIMALLLAQLIGSSYLQQLLAGATLCPCKGVAVHYRYLLRLTCSFQWFKVANYFCNRMVKWSLNLAPKPPACPARFNPRPSCSKSGLYFLPDKSPSGSQGLSKWRQLTTRGCLF